MTIQDPKLVEWHNQIKAAGRRNDQTEVVRLRALRKKYKLTPEYLKHLPLKLSVGIATMQAKLDELSRKQARVANARELEDTESTEDGSSAEEEEGSSSSEEEEEVSSSCGSSLPPTGPPDATTEQRLLAYNPSTALVPFGTGNTNNAMLYIIPFLPCSMASNPKAVSYMAAQAMYRQMDASTFLTFVCEERKTALEERKITLKEARLEKAARGRRRIREPELRTEMETVFGENFQALCDFDCGSVVNATLFHVARVDDELHICCRECYQVKRREGAGTRKMRMTPARVRCWMGRHGSKVLGNCFLCGPTSRKMHVLLDPWHASHDIARSKGGSAEATNLAPLHAQCNRNQGVQSFDDYLDTFTV